MVAYRFDPDYTVTGRHYAHPLIDWPTVIAGTLVAISLGFLLNVLGLAIGASAFNPFELEAQDTAISVGSGLYIVFAQLVALQLGAYVAVRAARYPDHFGGVLTGLTVWALAVFVVALMTAFAASAVSSGDAIPAGVAETVGELADATTGDPATAAELETAGEAADALAALSWWTFGALALGLAGAVAGGWLGAHHPTWETRPRLNDRADYRVGPEI